MGSDGWRGRVVAVFLSCNIGHLHAPIWAKGLTNHGDFYHPVLSSSLKAFLIQKYGPGANLGTELHRIIERAGHEVWPKTFVNLRSTRRTELERHFPHHVVNSWMGHGSKIANAHYLQVTDADWQAAEAFADPIGGDICAPFQPAAVITSAENAGKDDSCELVNTGSVPPPRFERGFSDGESDVLGH